MSFYRAATYLAKNINMLNSVKNVFKVTKNMSFSMTFSP